MDNLSSFLGNAGRQVGGIVNTMRGGGGGIMDSIAEKLRGVFNQEQPSLGTQYPKVVYGPNVQPITKNSSPEEWKSLAQNVGNQVIPKEESQGEVKGTSDKMTIKKTLDDGSKVTINIDMPNPKQEVPGGTDLAMNYIQSKTPPGMDFKQAFPAFGNEDFVQGLAQADQQRQGLGNLLALQAFFESTGGRNTPNIFGVKPGGQSQKFNNPLEALQYQIGPEVLGGGATPAMNILDEQRPLTLEDIQQLYGSYNPESAYLDQLLQILGGRQ